MQVIVTKVIPPTDIKGARIKATCDAGSVTIPFPMLSAEVAHRVAADTLAAKLGWNNDQYGKMVCGGLPGGAGYVFVFVKE